MTVRPNDRVFQAMGDETRLRILACLASSGECCLDVCACELVDSLQVKPSTLSSHLKILRDAGLVRMRKDGTWVYYRLNDELPGYLVEAIRAAEFPSADTDRLKKRFSLRVDGRCCVSAGALTN